MGISQCQSWRLNIAAKGYTVSQVSIFSLGASAYAVTSPVRTLMTRKKNPHDSGTYAKNLELVLDTIYHCFIKDGV